MVDAYGAIIRGDTTKKEIALVFTAHEFGDGGQTIRQTLNKQRINGSFFLTGDFYRNPAFKTIIQQLKKDGNYLGAHSDQHLLYADWTKRDSTLVTEELFEKDLRSNYLAMEKFGIKKSDAPYFLPPYEWYNLSISKWTKKQGLALINFSPGTRSTADYTWPEMGKSYRDSKEIYDSIINFEKSSQNGLNGFILLVHLGTDPRRTDKFYNQLDRLIETLKAKGYRFNRIDDLLK